MIRALVLVGAAAALMTATAACGSSSGGGPGGGGGNTPAPALTRSLTASQLAAAAAKEGSLTWYTTFSADDIAPMVAAFNKTYPGIKVNTLRLSADKIPQRVTVEQRAGTYKADVISGNSSYTGQLIQSGAFQPYTPPDAAPLPAGIDLPKGYQAYTYVTTTVIAYNPTVLKQDHLPAPKSFEDLTKPIYKGKFSIDPGAVNVYDSEIVALGHDAAKKLFTELGNNDPRFVESHTEALTDVSAGEPPIAATAYGYKASSMKKKSPSTVDFINPDPLPTGVDLLDVAKNAPHPNAARLFVDWMSSRAGQQAIVDQTNHTSLRSDVKNDPAVWNPAVFKPVYSHANLPAKIFNTYLAELKAALQAP